MVAAVELVDAVMAVQREAGQQKVQPIMQGRLVSVLLHHHCPVTGRRELRIQPNNPTVKPVSE